MTDDNNIFDEFNNTVKEIFSKALENGRLIRNPSEEELRGMAEQEPGVRRTKYGSVVSFSEPTSRAAMFTKNNVDSEFSDSEMQLLQQAKEMSSKEELVSIDVVVGDGVEGITARLLVPKRFAHVAYGGLKLFKPTITEKPTYQVIMFFDDAFEENKKKILPEKDITIRVAFSPEGEMVKIVRNSNYFGEWKKGIFAGEDWRAKQKGDALFLHAGCREDNLETADGGHNTQSSLFVALSANGKTSTTCKIIARKGKEQSWLVQDDGGILTMDASFKGFEAGGIFVKTDALNPKDQLETYYGTLKQSTFMENVHVDDVGDIDFYNVELTANGRAVLERRDFTHAKKDINVDRVDNIFIITRGKIIPAISKLTPEQATAFMVLGQSMESSAGDPTQSGKIKNVFFYDPFIAGDKTEHAGIFYKILKKNPHINCYLINTGGIGEGDKYMDIGLQDTMGVLDSVFRGGLKEWVESEATGLRIPKSVRTVDSILMTPEKLFPKARFEELQAELDKQRSDVLAKYPDLHDDVKAVFGR